MRSGVIQRLYATSASGSTFVDAGLLGELAHGGRAMVLAGRRRRRRETPRSRP